MTDPQRYIALATILAAAGMWLLLPRGTARGKAVGAVLVTIAGGLILAQVPALNGLAARSAFYLLAAVTLGSAVATVSLANPVYSAIWFGMSLAGTAGLFLYQGAEFLAAATIVVYAGAILVTFLFVLMLAQPRGRARYDRVSWEALISAATGAVMSGVLAIAVFAALGPQPKGGAELHPTAPDRLAQNVLAEDHVAQIGRELYGRHLLAVEVAAVLLLAALVGTTAIVSSRKESPVGRSATQGVGGGASSSRSEPSASAEG